ncbi:hypothetical protein EDB84DRAFT_1679399 [Lactarius hengduanensis]|nr:hypothetical protein EDB84DRAFT_1679399 [Lactarius hengduanensis]
MLLARRRFYSLQVVLLGPRRSRGLRKGKTKKMGLKPSAETLKRDQQRDDERERECTVCQCTFKIANHTTEDEPAQTSERQAGWGALVHLPMIREVLNSKVVLRAPSTVTDVHHVHLLCRLPSNVGVYPCCHKVRGQPATFSIVESSLSDLPEVELRGRTSALTEDEYIDRTQTEVNPMGLELPLANGMEALGPRVAARVTTKAGCQSGNGGEIKKTRGAIQRDPEWTHCTDDPYASLTSIRARLAPKDQSAHCTLCIWNAKLSTDGIERRDRQRKEKKRENGKENGLCLDG